MNQQIVGTVSGLEQRNGGWVAVSILAPGKDYPLKLSTKKQELIGQAQQMMGQVVTAGYNEQESTNINPNNGQPYTNRYLEAIAFGQVDLVGMPTQIQPQALMPQQPQPTFTPPPQQQAQNFPQPQVPPQPQPLIPQVRVSDDLREARIMRQAAAKVAVQLLDHLDPAERKLASLVAISEQLVGYFRDGVQWNVAPIQPSQPQAQQQHQAGYGYPADAPAQAQQYYGEPDPDDGIPFFWRDNYVVS